jgi:hypothetical protein
MMEGHIRHLHCRFRVLAGRESAAAEATRLEFAARQHLAEAFESALEQAFGDDPAVYVLRHVDCRLNLVCSSEVSEAEITRRWGEGLAGAVVRRLAAEPDEDEDSAWVRFDDQADYVAHFVADLLAGRAWERWFYGVFAPLRSLEKAAALRKALEQQTTLLPDILRGLQRHQALDALLAALSGEDRRWLWSQVRGTTAEGLAQAQRSLFMAGLHLADRLGNWSRPPPGDDALFAAYLATSPALADWRDRTSLAAAILDVLHFLASSDYLGWEMSGTRAAEAVVDRALADFDWLDTGWLKAGLLDLGGQKPANSTPVPEHNLPLPSWSNSPTPRMQKLLADLAAALGHSQRNLNAAFPQSPDNAVRLYAWLVSEAPGWAGDPMAAALIERLLAAWTWVGQAVSPSGLLRSLAQGGLSAALSGLPVSVRSEAAGALEFLASLGREGLAVVEAMGIPSTSGSGQRLPGSGPTTTPLDMPFFPGGWSAIDTQCAGAALLLRAILDAQLPSLARRTCYPPDQSNLLAGLFLGWTGPLGLIEGRLDPVLSYLAGLNSPPTLAELGAGWPAAGMVDFETGWMDGLASQRLLQGEALHLYRLPMGEQKGWALAAGDASGMVWPVGRAFQSLVDAATALAGWRSGWLEATGYDPMIIADDDLPLEDLSPGGTALPISKADQAMAMEHRLGGEHLQAAWTALGDPLPALVPARLVAFSLLRLWSRWLRQFSESSVPYLLDQFIRRPGRLSASPAGVWVELEPRPLDIVIEMAGYLTPLEGVPWLGGRTVHFRIAGG